MRPDRIRRPRPAILSVLLALAALAAACGESAPPPQAVDPGAGDTLEAAETPVPGGRLVVGVTGETNGWNPAINQWADAGSMVGSSVIEPLVVLDRNGEPQGWLLDTWSSNATFTEWDLTVKPNIVFHNGEPLNGEAVRTSLRGIFTEGLTKVALDPMYDRVEVTGPLSVRVYLERPWAAYPVGLNGAGYMMAPAMLAREDRGTVHPIGTGPFVFKEWTSGKSFKATKFDRYWRKDAAGRQLPYLDEIEFRPIPDDSQKISALNANDLDMVLMTSAEHATRARESGYTVITDYKSERTFVQLNTAETPDTKIPNPFTNVHARRALAHATDRKNLTLNFVGEAAETSSQLFPTDSRWALPEGQTGYPEFDLAKAREEIELYKRDTGRSELAFIFSGLAIPEDQRLMQALQAQWAELGIKAEIDSIEQAKYIILLALGSFQANWNRLYNWSDPDASYVFFTSENVGPPGGLSINFGHYATPELDALWRTGREKPGFEERKAAYDKAMREINSQVLNLWLFNTPYALVAAQKVRGLNPFRIYSIGNFNPKPWWGEVWIKR